MIPKIATCRARLARLSAVRNWSDASVSAPNSTSSTTIPPASRPTTSPNVTIRSSATAGAPPPAGSVNTSLLCRIGVSSGFGCGGGLRAGAGQTQDVLLGGTGGRQNTCDGAFAHHDDAVGESEDLGQVRRDDDHAEPLGREVTDHRVDLALGADVNKIGRFVEQKHLRLSGEPA